jgi:hypothetical protein
LFPIHEQMTPTNNNTAIDVVITRASCMDKRLLSVFINFSHH